jgi:hypothetical protein
VSVAIVGVWVLLAFAAVLCVVLLTAWATRHRRQKLLTTTGRGAIGRVLAVGSDDDGTGTRTHWVRVEYDNGSEAVTAKVTVSDRDRQRYRAGQRVGLTYASSRSQVVRLDPPEWAVPKNS